jgi:hypothetical protein
MRNTAQKRALRNHRSRLTKRGIARFEVLGLDVDRDLIRFVARRLAEEGPVVVTDNEKALSWHQDPQSVENTTVNP